MAAQYTNHHFVPKVYLKAWESSEDGGVKLNILDVDSRVVRRQDKRSVAKKNNLYTLPSEFAIEDHKTIEKHIVSIHEYKWEHLLNRTLHKNVLPVGKDLNSMKAFIVAQSFRSLKFKEDYEAATEKRSNGSDKLLNNYSIFFAQALTQGMLRYLSSSTLYVCKAPLGHEFITSDNPASHWILNSEKAELIETILEYQRFEYTQDYKIICPLTPTWIGVLSPNIGLPISLEDKFNCRLELLPVEEVLAYNDFTYQAAGRVIIAKNSNSFMKYQLI